MTVLVGLQDVPATERAELWRATASSTFAPLDIRIEQPSRFRGQLRGQELGELVVAEVTADAHQVHRTARLIARHDTGPHYKLTMPVHGRCLVEQHGRQAWLGKYDLALYDTNRPYSVVFEDRCRMLTLMFPHHALRLPSDKVAELTATTITGQRGVPALLGPTLAGLLSTMEEVAATQALRLADTVLGLVTTTLAELVTEDPAESVAGQRALLLRMQAFAEDHLADANLSPTNIAAAVHVSTGYLHKVFRTEGTTASRWIRSRRLEHCRRDLTNPAEFGLPVSEVAARWGFVDAAHFSRLFKNTYGVPPREYRILSELNRTA